MQSSLNVSSEFIDDVLFNVDPNITPSDLTITFVSRTTCVFNASFNTADKAQTMPGAGSAGTGFDVGIEFDNAPPAPPCSEVLLQEIRDALRAALACPQE